MNCRSEPSLPREECWCVRFPARSGSVCVHTSLIILKQPPTGKAWSSSPIVQRLSWLHINPLRQLAERLIEMERAFWTSFLPWPRWTSYERQNRLGPVLEKHWTHCTGSLFREVLAFYGCNYFMNDHKVLCLQVMFHSDLGPHCSNIFSNLQSPESQREGWEKTMTEELSSPDVRPSDSHVKWATKHTMCGPRLLVTPLQLCQEEETGTEEASSWLRPGQGVLSIRVSPWRGPKPSPSVHPSFPGTLRRKPRWNLHQKEQWWG